MTGFWEFMGAKHAVQNDSFTYGTATTGGAHRGHEQAQVGILANEGTRSMVYLPTPSVGGIDTVIIHDRMNLPNPIPNIEQYTASPSCTVFGCQADFLRFADKSPYIFQLHTDKAPVLSGNAFTWTTRASENAKLTALTPTSMEYEIVDEIALAATDANWNFYETPHQPKYHIKSWWETPQSFMTGLYVFQVGGNGTITKIEDSGKVEGVHLTRTGEADALVLFNSQTGGLINATGYHASHYPALEAIRYRGLGFTASWTAVATSTLAVLTDLSPGANWTINLDGAGATAIVKCTTTLTTNCLDSGGVYYFTVSGAGAHTMVLDGDG
jgi:hypothetical protein